mmetsp:Transcript_14690/g.41334  ORF Transcript_14690/g.41334 Transcript_14690/m.41334 type:complete len:292 (+) Transcript_14690:196-1071(+)
MGDSHAAFPERQEAGLSAHSLDVSAGELILCHDELLQVDVVAQRHFPCMNLEDAALSLSIREGKLDLPVNTARPDQRRVQALDAVSRHDDLDITHGIKSIHLVEQLKHCALDLALPTALTVVALRADCVNLVDEHNGGRQVIGDPEKLPHQLGPVSEVLLDELAAHDSEESSRSGVGDGLCKESLPCSRLAVKDHSLWRLYANVLVELRVCQWQLDCLLDFLDLCLQTTDVCVGLKRRLVDLHDADHGVRLIVEDTNHAEHLVVQQNGAARLELVLVHKGQDVDVVLRANG